MIVVNILLTLVFLIAIPVLLGAGVAKKSIGFNSYLSYAFFSYTFGHVILWAVFQIIAVPFILLKLKLSQLMWCWLAVVMIVLVLALFNKDRKVIKPTVNLSVKDNLIGVIALIFAVLLIAWQCWHYVFGMHLDQDDTRFVVNAVDAYSSDYMLLTNPATGEFLGTWIGDLTKDVSSPWSMYIAMLGKLLMVHPTIIAHTVLPSFILILSYASYWLIADELFKGDFNNCSMMLSFVALINIFYSKSNHTQSYVTLVRIWQGKAVVAAFAIPMLLYLLIRLYRSMDLFGFLYVFFAELAMCLLSGIGITLSGILAVSVTLWFVFVKKEWRMLLFVVLLCVPTLLYGGIYALL